MTQLYCKNVDATDGQAKPQCVRLLIEESMVRFWCVIMFWSLWGCGMEALSPTVGGKGSNAGGEKPTPSKQLYVNLGSSSQGNGSVDSPYKTIQAAVNAATADTEIRIAAGTYSEVIKLKSGVSLKGGYSPTSWKTNDISKFATTISDSGGFGGESIDQAISAISIANNKAPLAISNITILGGSVDADATSSSEYNESSVAIMLRNSTGVFIDNVKVTGGSAGQNTFGIYSVNSQMTLTNSTIEGGKGTNSYAVYIAGTSTAVAKGNKMYGFGTSNSGGLYSLATGNLNIEANRIRGGTGARACRGVMHFVPNAGISIFANNVIMESGCGDLNYGLDLRGETSRKGQVLVRNNTIIPSTTNNTALAASISLATIYEANIEITNNLILDYGNNLDGACIYEQDVNASPSMIRHNDMFGCNHLYRRVLGVTSNYYDTINAIENDVNLNADSNLALDPKLDSAYKFTGTPNTAITHGGIDGAVEEWSFKTDADGRLRTNDQNALGWTMGAFEFD